MNRIIMQDIDSFKAAYDPKTTDLVVNGRKFTFFAPKSIDRFIEGAGDLDRFPLWTKIWDSSFLLAGHLAELAPDPEKSLLELGSGLGVSGIVAAAFGHRITLTDHDADALAYARASAALNGYPELAVEFLDWRQPSIPRRFDLIVGAEILYKEENIPYILGLLGSSLKRGGRAIFAESVRGAALTFCRTASSTFALRVKKMKLKSQLEDVPMMFIEMTEKSPRGDKNTESFHP